MYVFCSALLADVLFILNILIMKPVLLLQLREVDEASQDEFNAFVRYSGLTPEDFVRVRMDKKELIADEINLDDYSAVMVAGGPWQVSDSDDVKSDIQRHQDAELFKLLGRIVEEDKPYYGACYGFGTLTMQQGGIESREKYAETAEAVTITLTEEAQNDPLLHDLPQSFRAFGGHKESCQRIPENAILLARSEICPHHMFRIGTNVYASQFHPELDANGLCLRIDIYRNNGYFAPEDAEPLKESARQESITVPMHILKRFIEKYVQ